MFDSYCGLFILSVVFVEVFGCWLCLFCVDVCLRVLMFVCFVHCLVNCVVVCLVCLFRFDCFVLLFVGVDVLFLFWCCSACFVLLFVCVLVCMIILYVALLGLFFVGSNSFIAGLLFVLFLCSAVLYVFVCLFKVFCLFCLVLFFVVCLLCLIAWLRACLFGWFICLWFTTKCVLLAGLFVQFVVCL